MCVLWGKRVLRVNNVTSFAPQHPYHLAETVLSSFSGHKGTPVGKRCHCQGGGRNSPFIWSLSTLLCPPTPPFLRSPFFSFFHWVAESEKQMVRKSGRLEYFYPNTANLHIDNYFIKLLAQSIRYSCF